MNKKCAFKIDERKCSVLKEQSCTKCHFFKTKEELDKGRKRAKARIKTLSPEKQVKFMEKYGEVKL